MKIKFAFAAAGLACGAALHAATLSVATAVQSQPDAASTVIVILPAGAEQPTPTDKVGLPPAGWIAVEVAGPFEGYVKNRDLSKQLDVMPGANVYVAPKAASGVLAVFAKGDKAEITGLHGSWTQVRLDKILVGYIQTGGGAPETASAAPVAAPPTAPTAPAPAAPAPTASSDDGSVSLSRLFEGTLATTKSMLLPKRPYDWQLVDPSGKRIAFVDISKLLLTDQIDNYSGHGVVVLGSLKPVKDTNDLVILVEGLRLK
jgi:pyruvate/2-oxoglutarate dehydrogenase complex dihydrolipoamide acyltransferase (E2) component